ncbi:MAG TPA: hypothetical protein GX736_03065 [Mogibacterium sp.]|nr:hypothetical protein [Mogibacterium sp.]
MSKQIIKRIRNIVNRKKVIKEIAKKNGKSYSEIKHSVQVAKEKYGITLNEYKKYNLSKVNENKIEEEYKNQKKRERNRKAVKEYAVNAAIKEANFNIKEAIADVDDSKKFIE